MDVVGKIYFILERVFIESSLDNTRVERVYFWHMTEEPHRWPGRSREDIAGCQILLTASEDDDIVHLACFCSYL